MLGYYTASNPGMELFNKIGMLVTPYIIFL